MLLNKTLRYFVFLHNFPFISSIFEAIYSKLVINKPKKGKYIYYKLSILESPSNSFNVRYNCQKSGIK